MQELIQTCDRCGKRSSNKDKKHFELVTVSVIRNDRTRFDGYRSQPGVVWRREVGELKAEWCPDCLAEMGLNADMPQKVGEDKPTMPPTLEDVIRELIRDEIKNCE